MSIITKKWTPTDRVETFVVNYGDPHRGYTMRQLWDRSSFYTRKILTGSAGITFHRNRIVFDERVLEWEEKRQARITYHGLVHVSQKLTFPQGWVGFMSTYLWQWMRAGFSYEKIKSFGIEKEAYDADFLFAIKIANVFLNN